MISFSPANKLTVTLSGLSAGGSVVLGGSENALAVTLAPFVIGPQGIQGAQGIQGVQGPMGPPSDIAQIAGSPIANFTPVNGSLLGYRSGVWTGVADEAITDGGNF